MIEIDFTKLRGLVPVIVQDYDSNEILMQAFMNQDAWQKTLETGKAHYWSRSRNSLWMKGESSGNIQEVKEIRIDCDMDSILLKVNQIGKAACHTGYRSCFYRKLDGDTLIIDGEKVFNPEKTYDSK